MRSLSVAWLDGAPPVGREEAWPFDSSTRVRRGGGRASAFLTAPLMSARDREWRTVDAYTLELQRYACATTSKTSADTNRVGAPGGGPLPRPICGLLDGFLAFAQDQAPRAKAILSERIHVLLTEPGPLLIMGTTVACKSRAPPPPSPGRSPTERVVHASPLVTGRGEPIVVKRQTDGVFSLGPDRCDLGHVTEHRARARRQDHAAEARGNRQPPRVPGRWSWFDRPRRATACTTATSEAADSDCETTESPHMESGWPYQTTRRDPPC